MAIGIVRSSLAALSRHSTRPLMTVLLCALALGLLGQVSELNRLDQKEIHVPENQALKGCTAARWMGRSMLL